MSKVTNINKKKVFVVPKDVEISVVIGWKDENFYMLTADNHVGETVLLLELAKKFQLEAMFE